MTRNPTHDADGEPVEIGDVVQLDPESDPVFGGCLLTIDETLGFGVHGYVSAPDAAGPMPYFFRAESKTFKRVGRSAYRVPEGT